MRTILLVEEDPLEASMRVSVLEKRFPDVTRVADPVEALCLIEQPDFAEKLGLVISGHHRFGLGGGPAFVAELHARKPALPILVLGKTEESASGYAGAGIRFLASPIPVDEMVAAVSQLLGGSQIRLPEP